MILESPDLSLGLESGPEFGLGLPSTNPGPDS